MTMAIEGDILVTGSNGFLGVALVRRMIERNFKRVKCLVRKGSDRRRLDALLKEHPEADVTVVGGDLSSPGEAAKLLPGVGLILHLAAALKGPPAEMFLGTVVTSKNLLEAVVAIEPSSRPKILLISSFGVYGASELKPGALLDETTELERAPAERDHYSHAKHRQEQVFSDYRAKHGIAYTVLRPGVIYGPYGGAFSSRVGIAFPGFFLYLGGKNTLPLSYVDNCAEAICVAAMNAKFDGDAYNVLDDDLLRCDEYLARYQAEVGRLRVVPSPFALTMALSHAVAWYHRHSHGQLPAIFTPYKTRSSWKGTSFSNRKLHAIGFSPIVSTEEGLKRTFAYLRSKAS